jgi:hypothetical protein
MEIRRVLRTGAVQTCATPISKPRTITTTTGRATFSWPTGLFWTTSIENGNNLVPLRTTTMERPRLLIILLAAGVFVGGAPSYLSQIADYGAAQLARQAVVIRAPYLAQMAQITYLQKSGKQQSGAGPSRKAAVTPRTVNTTPCWRRQVMQT